MILTCKHQSCVESQPGTFAGLMDLYERNYISMRRLIPDMPASKTSWRSQTPGGLNLHLQILERFRYTTELSLTYYFKRNEQWVAEPDLYIRIYHDARLAEVISARLRHRPYFVAEAVESDRKHLNSRWHVNRFLYKWLHYCLHQGHSFSDARETTVSFD